MIQGDPYRAPERVARLHLELERFRAQVGSLEEPLEREGGLSVLDARWKELQEQQEKDARQLSIAIARCYSMKNRHQDVMPYDVNRVVLQSGKDDYINASYVEELSPYCPRLIATQAPLAGTAADFWLMVYEQKVSLVVMLVSEQELEKVPITSAASPPPAGGSREKHFFFGVLLFCHQPSFPSALRAKWSATSPPSAASSCSRDQSRSA